MAVHELFYDPLAIAYDEGRWIAPIGGHSDHVHVSFADAESAVQIIDYARSLGLRVTENPYVGSVGSGVHTRTSYHYRTFAEKVRGQPVGMALDASGSPSQMAKFALWVKSTYIAGGAPPGASSGTPGDAGSSGSVAAASGAGCLVAAVVQVSVVAGAVVAVVAWVT